MIFAVDFITRPNCLSHEQNAMRKHILKSTEDGVMSAIPPSASNLMIFVHLYNPHELVFW